MGNIMSSRDCHERVLEWIAMKRDRYFCSLGDEVEAICVDDKRFQWDAADPENFIPLQQIKTVIKLYEKVAKRGLVWLDGNHNFALHRFGNLAAHAAGELQIPFGTASCKLLLKDKHGPIAKVFLMHPSRVTIRSNAKDWEQRRANMQASLKRLLVNKAGDCLVMAMGHVHLLLTVPPAHRLILTDDGKDIRQTYLGAGDGNGGYIEPERRWYAATGSFLRTQVLGISGYAERMAMDPVELGHVVVRVRDRKIVAVDEAPLE